MFSKRAAHSGQGARAPRGRRRAYRNSRGLRDGLGRAAHAQIARLGRAWNQAISEAQTTARGKARDNLRGPRRRRPALRRENRASQPRAWRRNRDARRGSRRLRANLAARGPRRAFRPRRRHRGKKPMNTRNLSGFPLGLKRERASVYSIPLFKQLDILAGLCHSIGPS